MKWLLALFLLNCNLAVMMAAAPRNVVLFVSDDHGMEIGAYGNPVIQTPAMDWLASKGTLYQNAFCTTPSCSPSRAGILTGLHAHSNGQYGLSHDIHKFRALDNIRSLAGILGEHGYHTIRAGKFHVAPEKVFNFETIVSADQRSARNPVAMAEACRTVLGDRSRPFFLYFCTADPHRGGKATELPYAANPFGNGWDHEGVSEVIYDSEDIIVPPFLPDNPACRAELKQYYQSVSRVDQGLGRLIQVLKELGQYENTLIIYTSDHGMAMPGAKVNLYDAGIRVPLIVRSPEVERGGVASDAMISLVDLTPTILEFAGVGIPEGLHGRSFVATLGNDDLPGWDEVYAALTFHEVTMYYPMRAVRTRNYKLIFNIAHGLRFPHGRSLENCTTWQWTLKGGNDPLFGRRRVSEVLYRPKFELYDLEKDPDEVRNLADDPSYADIFESLRDKIRKFQETTRDPWYWSSWRE